MPPASDIAPGAGVGSPAGQPLGRGHLFLVGATGVGKSTVAPLLARRLGRPAIDLDERIEAAAGMSVTDIFEGEGEASFRAREASALRDVASSPVDAVVATGGGAPGHHDGMAVMDRAGPCMPRIVKSRFAGKSVPCNATRSPIFQPYLLASVTSTSAPARSRCQAVT